MRRHRVGGSRQPAQPVGYVKRKPIDGKLAIDNYEVFTAIRGTRPAFFCQDDGCSETTPSCWIADLETARGGGI